MRLLELLAAYCIEGFLFVAAGFGIINIRLKLSKIFYLAIIYGLLIYGIRQLYEIYKIPFGTHSFVIITLYIIILRFIGKQRWSSSIISTLMSFLLVSLGEALFLFNFLKLLNITIEDVLYKPGFRIIGTLLSDVLLIIVFIIVYIFKLYIIDLNAFNENEEVKV